VSIAGDCCAAIGELAGLQRAGINPLFIWFDAHGDFNILASGRNPWRSWCLGGSKYNTQ